MTTTISGVVKATVSVDHVNTVDLGSSSFPLRVSASHTLANGTGADQIGSMFSDQRTLTASATEELDLAGVLTDLYGQTITFTKIRAILIKAAAANANNVLVGGAASNAFSTFLGDATDVIVIRPGGTLLLVAPDATGYAVTAGTGDKLKIANSAGGTSVVYDIVLLGTV